LRVSGWLAASASCRCRWINDIGGLSPIALCTSDAMLLKLGLVVSLLFEVD